MDLSQATRFYETLALLIANKYGVDIKVTVTPRDECGTERQNARELSAVIVGKGA